MPAPRPSSRTASSPESDASRIGPCNLTTDAPVPLKCGDRMIGHPGGAWRSNGNTDYFRLALHHWLSVVQLRTIESEYVIVSV